MWDSIDDSPGTTEAHSRRRQLAAWLMSQRTRRIVLGCFLIATLIVGSGIQTVQISTSLSEFRTGTSASAADEYIESNLSTVGPNATTGLLVVRDDRNVLTKRQYLAHLRAQRALLRNDTVAPTLHDDRRPVGMANVVAIIAMREATGQSIRNISTTPQPPLDEQIAQLKSVPPWRVKLFTSYAVGIVLDDVNHRWPPGGAFAFVPVTYEPAQKASNTTAIAITYDDRTDPKRLSNAQHTTAAILDRKLVRGNAFSVGDGMVNQELRQSSVDSLRLVGPFALLLVLVVLSLTYREALNTLLGLGGVVLVLGWTFGAMGWLGITFTQLLVVVPALLVGLSIDYGIHVLTRYRTWRMQQGASPRTAMTNALAGVSLAMVLVTVTTVIGFLSTVTSGVGPIRQFGLVSAIGICATLVVFGVVIPALKLELAPSPSEAELQTSTHDRLAMSNSPDEPAGIIKQVLYSTAVKGALRAPRLIIGVALITALAGGALATDLPTNFEEDDLLVDDTPTWMERLPEPLKPAEYTANQHINYLERTGYVAAGTKTEILVRGDVTAPQTLERIATETNRVNRSQIVLRAPNEEPVTRNPVMAMRSVAAQNTTFNATMQQADQDGDGIPDRNLSQVYRKFFSVAPEIAPTVIHQSRGEFRALRITISVTGEPSEQRVSDLVRGVARDLSGEGLTATATGRPVENQAVAHQLRETMQETLVITLGVVLTLLTVVYWTTESRPAIGSIVVIPVLFVLSWVFGSMALLGIPFNVMTAIITGLTVGMGVDYSIHMTERFLVILDRTGSVNRALKISVCDTGRALASSAATTAGGFGMLAVAIMVPLQLFGTVAALTIIYSFLASVLVLPCLLIVWTNATEMRSIYD